MYEFSYPSCLPGSTDDPVSHGQGKKSYGSVPMQKRGRMGTEEEWMGQGPPRHVVTPGQDSVLISESLVMRIFMAFHEHID